VFGLIQDVRREDIPATFVSAAQGNAPLTGVIAAMAKAAGEW